MGLLDGKVVLVTGAGGGIGRCHALACAAEGARVVVNDLGGSRDGVGDDASMASRVVAEIKAAGGDAVPNFDSVTSDEGATRMVQAALDAWGRLDVVVNNAGILRDRTFAKMTDLEWNAVVDVHLNGTKNVTRAALPALQAQGGAIINTTSYSGMIGNFGQSNYAAAKAGIYGLSRVLAMELKKSGITVNCVAPVAKTRMTDDISMVPDDFRPEQISPIVVFLASDLAKGVTGKVFGVQGQRIHLYEVKTNDGVEKAGDDLWTVTEIAEKLGAITSFEEAPAAAPAGDDLVSTIFSHFPAGFRAGKVPGWKAVIQWKVKGGTSQTVTVDGDACTVSTGLVGTPTCTVTVGRDDLVDLLTGKLEAQKAFMTGKAAADNMGDLMKMAQAFDFKAIASAYAGGSGTATSAAPQPAVPEAAPVAKAAPIGKRYDAGYWFVERKQGEAYAAATDDHNPRYQGKGAVAPPMFHVRPFIALMFKMATDPELEIDMLRLVHGEHDVSFHRALRHGDVLDLRGELLGVDPKSSGTVYTFGLRGFVDGQTAIEGKTSYFVRAPKKADAGPKKEAGPAPEPPPAPDWTAAQPVTPDQATRYADASGDENPIHVDPAVAKAAGLPGVILHGLCTMAFAQRDIVDTLCGGDPERLKRLSVRFAAPVFPGQTLTLKGWGREGEIRFMTENEQGKPVITNGIAVVA